MMKKLYPFLIALIFIGGAMGQGCLPEGITFDTQSQIDNFQINYPGCTEIEGDVTINGWYILNLDGLNNLNTIVGDLLVIGSGLLINLEGLESLTSIGGDLQIGTTFPYFLSNQALINLIGLDNLTSIGGSLKIYDNPVLTSLEGIDNLSSLGDSLIIEKNASLTSFTGLESLSSIDSVLWIINNDALVSLPGLENITSIYGSITITGNDALVSLSGLENITSIYGSITVSGNDGLTDIEGLTNVNPSYITDLSIGGNPLLNIGEPLWLCPYLENPGGIVNISGNSSGCNSVVELADKCGGSLPCLPYGNYSLSKQTDIDNFESAFPDCDDLEGNLIIYGDDILDLNGITHLTSIGGSFDIYRLDSITNLSELYNLLNIGGSLVIRFNYMLSNLIGLNNLSAIGDGLVISHNPDLITIEGLNNISSIGGSLKLIDNPNLNSLEGLNNIVSIGGWLNVMKNHSLTSLNGLENLNTIDGSLFIYQNNSLNSLVGIDNIEEGSIIDIYIDYNPFLSTCEVESICNYLVSPNGETSIQDNAIGCNSPEEVQDSCVANAVTIGEFNFNEDVTIYPNPSSTQITIELPSTPQKNTSLTIYNLNGQQLITQTLMEPQTVVDISGFPKGVYFVKVVNDEKVMMGKVVKE